MGLKNFCLKILKAGSYLWCESNLEPPTLQSNALSIKPTTHHSKLRWYYQEFIILEVDESIQLPI